MEDSPCLLDPTLSGGLVVLVWVLSVGKQFRAGLRIVVATCMWSLEDSIRIQVVAQVGYAEEVVDVPFGKVG